MKISRKSNAIEPSLTRDLFNRALKLGDVINLTLGDPDLPPPQSVRDAACDAIQKGKTRYSANAGLLELRQVIAESFTREHGLPCNPAEEVITTVGGMEALYLALSSSIDPGDEVIIFAPYYVNYVQMVRMNGGIPVIIETNESDGFAVDPGALESRLSDKTVAIIVNTPCNPPARYCLGPCWAKLPGWQGRGICLSFRTKFTSLWSMTVVSISRCCLSPECVNGQFWWIPSRRSLR